jgi:ABC-type nickel/cobalt efflux system permease component RcnA
MKILVSKLPIETWLLYSTAYSNMTDTNTEGSHPEQDDHDSDSVCTDCGADHAAKNMNSKNQGEYQ